MRKIKFIKLGNNKIWNVLLPVAFILLIYSIVFLDKNSIARYFNVAAFFIVSIYFLRVVFYKNYVEWSKKGMSYKINELFGKNIVFKYVERIDFEKDEYVVYDHYGYEKKINLSNIDDESKSKLKEILEVNTLLK